MEIGGFDEKPPSSKSVLCPITGGISSAHRGLLY